MPKFLRLRNQKPNRRRRPPLNSSSLLERLTSLHPKAIDLALDRMRRLLDALGNPEEKLPPVIHVAGTNGKGSTLAFLRAIFEAAGLRVHVYSSPHLIRFHERIVLAGREIDETTLVEALRTCETVNDGAPITFFEITTAAALLAFSQHPADVVLLETGLGGRYDSTNVIARPVLTLLTPISMDHQDFLGSELGGIAREKAGILKTGVPCLCAKQERKSMPVIRDRATTLGVPLTVEGKDWFVVRGKDGFTFRSGNRERRFPLPALAGKHQISNAGLAIASMDTLAGQFAITDQTIALGLKTVRWPGRMQRLTEGTLAEAIPKGWEVWLDGGHNPAATKALAGQFRQWRGRPLFLVFGMQANRDPIAFLKPIAGHFNRAATVAFPIFQNSSHSAETCADAAAQLGISVQTADSLLEAVTSLTENGEEGGIILIGGSLGLAGHALRVNEGTDAAVSAG